MKTIKGATGSKSSLFGKLALPLLLLIAIFGITIGGNQSVPRSAVADNATEIGGQSIPPSRPFNIGGNSAPKSLVFTTREIGGPGIQGASKDTKPSGTDIGGTQTAPRGFAVSDPIGGNGTPRTSGTGVTIDIGGQHVPRDTRPIADIGGQNQQKPRDTNPLGIEIGGQSAPRTGGFISSFLQDCTVDIGGNQSVPVPRPFGIGGNGAGSQVPRNGGLGLI